MKWKKGFSWLDFSFLETALTKKENQSCFPKFLFKLLFFRLKNEKIHRRMCLALSLDVFMSVNRTLIACRQRKWRLYEETRIKKMQQADDLNENWGTTLSGNETWSIFSVISDTVEERWTKWWVTGGLQIFFKVQIRFLP